MKAKTLLAPIDEAAEAARRVRIREQARRIGPFLRQCRRALDDRARASEPAGRPTTLHIKHKHWCDYFSRDPDEGLTCTCTPEVWAES